MSRKLILVLASLLALFSLVIGGVFTHANAATPPAPMRVNSSLPLCLGGIPKLPALCLKF